MKYFICFVLLSVLLSSCTCSFAGLWSDSRKGGSFSICVNNDTANGIYSEFGLAVGTLSDNGNTWEGTWYEGGVGDCLTGNFSLTLSADVFQGTYNCANNASLNFTWTATRNSTDNQTAIQCGDLADQYSHKSMQAKWAFETSAGLTQVDFCVNDYEDDDDTKQDFYASSFRPAFISQGFDTGYTARGNTIGGGSFWRGNENGALPGSSLWFLSSEGTLVNLWWAGHYDYLNLDLISDTDLHDVDVYSLKSGTSEEQCRRYEQIEYEPYDYYPYEYELFYFMETSSASNTKLPKL